jgi:SAM-dependent methyltransferase
VLDIGCGSGRDLAALHKLCFQPYGLDGTPELVELAQQLHPELRGRVVQGVDASIKLSQVSHQILSHLVNGFSLTQLWISLMVLRVRLFLSWVWLWVF